MKKNNIITLSLLLVYTITFLFLFMRLRNMSSAVLEELGEKNIYYILGFMFISGISASLYLIMEANNKNFAIEVDEKSEVIINADDELEEKGDAGITDNLSELKNLILSKFNQNENSEDEKTEKIVWEFCNHFEISQALLYINTNGQHTLKSSYAFVSEGNDSKLIFTGEGLAGQAVKDRTPYFIKDIPEGYLKVISGLGESLPKSLLIIPCVVGGEVSVVFELSSLRDYSKDTFDEIVIICNYISSLLTK